MDETQKKIIDLLFGEYSLMQQFSEKLFSQYYTSLYVLAVAIGAVVFLIVKEQDKIKKVLEEENPSQEKKIFFSLVPSFLLSAIGAWAGLWLYMNKELWMARLYLGTLEQKIAEKLPEISNFNYYSEFIWEKSRLYSSEYHWNLLLNLLVAQCIIIAIAAVVFCQHRVLKIMNVENKKRYLGVFYFIFIVIFLLIGSTYFFVISDFYKLPK